MENLNMSGMKGQTERKAECLDLGKFLNRQFETRLPWEKVYQSSEKCIF